MVVPLERMLWYLLTFGQDLMCLGVHILLKNIPIGWKLTAVKKSGFSITYVTVAKRLTLQQ